MASTNVPLSSEAIDDYNYDKTFNNLSIASMVLLLYDTLLTLGREVRFVWQQERKMHQRVLYVINRYMPLVEALLLLRTIGPLPDWGCAAIQWSMSVCVVLTTMGFIVFPAMCAYALSGKSKAIGGVVAVTGLGAIAYTAVLNFWITPVNLPPPDNCSIVYPISVPLQTILSIVTAISSIVGLSLATIVTWRKTRQSVAPPSGDSSTHRRANLPQLMFNYGMAYSCAVLTIDIVDVTLQALAFTEPGAADGDTYLSFFAGPITSILISRLMLDLFETNARMERGGASNTGSFSVNINSGNRGTRGRGRSGSPSMPIFLNPYSSGSLTQAQFSDVRDAVEYNRNTHDTANSACRESPPAESTHGEAVTYSSEGDGTIV